MQTNNDECEELEDEFDKQMKNYLGESGDLDMEAFSEELDEESSILQVPQNIQNDKNFLNKRQCLVTKGSQKTKDQINVDKGKKVKIKKQETSQNSRENITKVIHPHNRVYSCQQLRELQQKKITVKPQWNSYFVNTKKKIGSYGFGNNEKIKEALKKKESIINISEPLALNIVGRSQNWELKKNRELLEKSRKKYHKQRQFCGFKPRILRS